MAFRRPLKIHYPTKDLKEMSDSDILSLRHRAIYCYGTDPSVKLNYVNDSGNLGTMIDQRSIAGAGQTSLNDALGNKTSLTSISWSKINLQFDSSFTGGIVDSGSQFPVYWDSANDAIRAMTDSDFYDTITRPAINILTNGSLTNKQAGIFHFSTDSASDSDSTLVTSNPIFIDTVADVEAYRVGSLYETIDQPKTLEKYYLHKMNADSSISPGNLLPKLLKIYQNTADSNHVGVQEYDSSGMDDILCKSINHTAKNDSQGYC